VAHVNLFIHSFYRSAHVVTTIIIINPLSITATIYPPTGPSCLASNYSPFPRGGHYSSRLPAAACRQLHQLLAQCWPAALDIANLCLHRTGPAG
jgi:hypothetical protein